MIQYWKSLQSSFYSRCAVCSPQSSLYTDRGGNPAMGVHALRVEMLQKPGQVRRRGPYGLTQTNFALHVPYMEETG